MRTLIKKALISFCCLLQLSCASKRVSDQESDTLFKKGSYTQAAERLGKALEAQGENSKDELHYLLDIGLAYHCAGLYEESNQSLLKADRIADIKDYTSLSKEAATLLVSENIQHYKGEDFEKILIHVYLAMNYALLGATEDALVEARRVNHKLHLMVSQGERKYKQNAFARYLSAILYESEKNYNDAYIDYQKTYELLPTIPQLGRDLWRCAKLLHMPDEMEKWDGIFKLDVQDHKKALELNSKSKKGEIIILYENGISPIKKPHPSFHSIPQFFPRENPVNQAIIRVNGLEMGTPLSFENIEETAIKNLDEKYSSIIGKKLAGIATKEALAYGISQKSPLLGQLTRMTLYATDQADLRSWNLLPKELQILRIPVEPGTYTIEAQPVGQNPLPSKVIQVSPQKKVFVNFRYIP